MIATGAMKHSSGGVGGAILMAVIGIIRNQMAKK
jgi:hypothetical protein